MIYEGPLEQEPWLGFLEALRERLDCIAVDLHLRLPSPGVKGFNVAVSDWDVRLTRDYYESLYHLDPFDYDAMQSGGIYSWFDFVDPASFHQSEYYLDFCRPLDYEYAVCLCVEEPTGLRALIHLAHTGARGDFTQDELDYCTALVPHLRRALALLARIQYSDAEKVAYETAVNQMAIGTLLLGHDGKVIACNQAATRLLEEDESLSIHHGALRLADRTQQRKLKQAIDAMLTDPGPDHIEVCSGSGSPRALSFLIRTFPQMPIDTDRQPAMLVYVTAPSAGKLPPQQLVGEVFGLTATEARLAVLLADGSSLLEAAQLMGITESTVRTYSKRIFGKTGVSRQSELVRLVLKSVVQLAETEG